MISPLTRRDVLLSAGGLAGLYAMWQWTDRKLDSMRDTIARQGERIARIEDGSHPPR